MGKLLVFIFSICISTALMGQTHSPSIPSVPASLPATAKPAATQAKLEILWKAYEQAYGVGMTKIKGYRKIAVIDVNVAKLDDPQMQERVLAELGKAFGKKASETFTDAEIEYLIRLFSNPIAKKLNQMEQQFWGSTSPILTTVLSTPPTAPQPKSAPKLPPKK